MAIDFTDTLQVVEVAGKAYEVDLGDPELVCRIQAWAEREDDLALPEDGKVTLEKYEVIMAYLTDILGEDAITGIFGGRRNVFLALDVSVRLEPAMKRFGELVDATVGNVSEG